MFGIEVSRNRLDEPELVGCMILYATLVAAIKLFPVYATSDRISFRSGNAIFGSIGL